MHEGELELLELAREGDLAARNALLDRYVQLVKRYTRGHKSEHSKGLLKQIFAALFAAPPPPPSIGVQAHVLRLTRGLLDQPGQVSQSPLPSTPRTRRARQINKILTHLHGMPLDIRTLIECDARMGFDEPQLAWVMGDKVDMETFPKHAWEIFCGRTELTETRIRELLRSDPPAGHTPTELGLEKPKGPEEEGLFDELINALVELGKLDQIEMTRETTRLRASTPYDQFRGWYDRVLTEASDFEPSLGVDTRSEREGAIAKLADILPDLVEYGLACPPGNTIARVFELIRQRGVAPSPGKLRVMILGSNPRDHFTRVHRDQNQITTCLKDAYHDGKIDMSLQFLDCDVDDIFRYVGSDHYDVLHISAHGSAEDGLCLGGSAESPKYLSFQRLAELIVSANKPDRRQCVTLAVCHSSEVLDALPPGLLTRVIGAVGRCDDEGAVTFIQGFYSALAERRSFRRCFLRGQTRADAGDGIYEARMYPN